MQEVIYLMSNSIHPNFRRVIRPGKGDTREVSVLLLLRIPGLEELRRQVGVILPSLLVPQLLNDDLH